MTNVTKSQIGQLTTECDICCGKGNWLERGGTGELVPCDNCGGCGRLNLDAAVVISLPVRNCYTLRTHGYLTLYRGECQDANGFSDQEIEDDIVLLAEAALINGGKQFLYRGEEYEVVL